MNYHVFRYTKASLLAPWFYTQIPAAAIFGFLIFSEIPHWTTFARGTYRHRGDLEQLASKGKIFGMKSEMLEGRLFVALEGVMQACRLGTLESRPEFTDDALTTLFFRDKKFFNANIIDI